MEKAIMQQQENQGVSRVEISIPALQIAHSPYSSKKPVEISIWNEAVATLGQKVSPHNLELWFDPISCLSIDESFITLQAPNTFIRDWFEIHYLPIVLETIMHQSGAYHQVLWVIKEQESTLKQGSAAWSEQTTLSQKEVQKRSITSSPNTTTEIDQRIFSHYNFNNFIVGPSNQLAEAASKAVAMSPSAKYNPLFIYGSVGLGKTHLLCAIGNEIKKHHPHWNITYLKTESFVNEYIYALRTQKIDDFRKRYRELPDVLLVDDVQYLKGKERTQDEFFHTFNALFEAKKQIVLTADRYPHEIPDIESRLLSRFQWGLTADIQAPDLETRLAILLHKAEEKQLNLPVDVAQFLALHIRSNIRELEGALTRLAAFSNLKAMPLSVDLAKETLKAQLSYGSIVSIESVQQEVARHFHIQVSDLKSASRKQSLAKPRQIAMYLTRKLCQSSYPELGAKFGGKDHTTVMAACRKIESLHQSDASIRQLLCELENKLGRIIH